MGNACVISAGEQTCSANCSSPDFNSFGCVPLPPVINSVEPQPLEHKAFWSTLAQPSDGLFDAAFSFPTGDYHGAARYPKFQTYAYSTLYALSYNSYGEQYGGFHGVFNTHTHSMAHVLQLEMAYVGNTDTSQYNPVASWIDLSFSMHIGEPFVPPTYTGLGHSDGGYKVSFSWQHAVLQRVQVLPGGKMLVVRGRRQIYQVSPLAPEAGITDSTLSPKLFLNRTLHWHLMRLEVDSSASTGSLFVNGALWATFPYEPCYNASTPLWWGISALTNSRCRPASFFVRNLAFTSAPPKGRTSQRKGMAYRTNELNAMQRCALSKNLYCAAPARQTHANALVARPSAPAVQGM